MLGFLKKDYDILMLVWGVMLGSLLQFGVSNLLTLWKFDRYDSTQMVTLTSLEREIISYKTESGEVGRLETAYWQHLRKDKEYCLFIQYNDKGFPYRTQFGPEGVKCK